MHSTPDTTHTSVIPTIAELHACSDGSTLDTVVRKQPTTFTKAGGVWTGPDRPVPYTCEMLHTLFAGDRHLTLAELERRAPRTPMPTGVVPPAWATTADPWTWERTERVWTRMVEHVLTADSGRRVVVYALQDVYLIGTDRVYDVRVEVTGPDFELVDCRAGPDPPSGRGADAPGGLRGRQRPCAARSGSRRGVVVSVARGTLHATPGTVQAHREVENVDVIKNKAVAAGGVIVAVLALVWALGRIGGAS